MIINRVLDLLSLRSIAGAYIGYGGAYGGINDNERKRLSMAVELVAEPSILFLDEPTSGLGTYTYLRGCDKERENSAHTDSRRPINALF